MTPAQTIETLLAAAAQTAAEDDRAAARQAARVAWAREAVAAMITAQDRVQQAWDRMLDALPDEDDDEALEALPEPPEQAELDAIMSEIEAVRTHDRWPREMHWGDV